MPICPADPHFIEDLSGLFCAQHGVRWFEVCSLCGAEWTTERTSPYNYLKVAGDHFCAGCGAPAPWLTRPQLMTWIRNQIRASDDVPAATREELLQTLARLQEMTPDDTKAVADWRQMRDTAPKIWEATKPIRDALIDEAVKKALGL